MLQVRTVVRKADDGQVLAGFPNPCIFFSAFPKTFWKSSLTHHTVVLTRGGGQSAGQLSSRSSNLASTQQQ